MYWEYSFALKIKIKQQYCNKCKNNEYKKAKPQYSNNNNRLILHWILMRHELTVIKVILTAKHR